jgi:DNA-binding NarL/FixJ family response regulator
MVVDDDEQVRLLARLVLEQNGFDVVATAESYDAALERVDGAEVAVVDLRLRGRSGAELARELTALGVRVLIYTGAEDREALRSALRAGATGIALKGDSINGLPAAVAAVAAGEPYIASRLRDLVERADPGRLSPREREVLFLLATGLNNDEVAVELGLSPQTTKTQLKNAMRKLGARSRLEAVTIASAEGEITLP